MKNTNLQALIRKHGGLHAARNALADLQAQLVAQEVIGEQLLDNGEIGSRFREAIGHRTDERFAAIFLDQARKVLGPLHVFEGGSRTRTTLYPRILFKEALERDATGIILAHNHPGGTCFPSPQDRELTRRVRELGEALEVRLVDHFIVTTTEFVSFNDKGWN